MLLGRLGLKDLDVGNIGTARRRIEVLPEAEPVHAPNRCQRRIRFPEPTGLAVPVGPAQPAGPTAPRAAGQLRRELGVSAGA